MKILHVIDSCGIYGAENMLLNLMVEQKSLGHTPVLLSLGSVEEGVKEIETQTLSCGVQVKRVRALNGLSLLLKAPQLLREGEREGFDIIHSHGYQGNIMFGLIPKLLRSVPVVSTMHGWTIFNKKNKMLFYKMLDRISLTRLNARVTVNANNLNFSNIQDNRKTKDFVIENGISEITFSTDCIAKADETFMKFCENGYIIGAIGRLSSEKGFEYLIESIDRLQRYNKCNCKLVLIGEGECRQQIEEFISQKSLVDKVLLLGYRENAHNYMKFFDVLVISSITEGLPIILLEAMQAKCPIIATDVGGISKVLGDGSFGKIVSPKSPIEIAENVEQLMTSPIETRKMVDSAFKHAIINYSSRKMCEQYMEVYTILISD